ncbi:MAG: translocation/assembly module TamB domain-containing protein [Xenococcaceae cyanobacterium MO_188.B32]|nr:translocation/assembly module TamB domain-containing protein [Xenococcaceae cyanobacterium MO_188.B32]
MTIQKNRPPNPPPNKSNLIINLLQKLKRPSKKVTIIGISGIVLGIGGYWGLQVLVKKKLPPFLEKQIGNIIDRPIDLGEVKGFSLNGIRFDKTTIPATATDPDYVTVEEVKVGFNILPVIFRRTLPLEVTLVQPKVYAEQEQNGEWLNLDFLQSESEEKKELLIYFDVSVDVEEGDITAVPYNQPPIEIAIDGSGRYNPVDNTQIEYDLEAAIAKAKATIVGETIIETGKTDTKLLINDLALRDIATLLPNPPVNLSSGTLNADLDVNIPSFEEINSTNIEGILSLQGLSGKVKELDAPIKARSRLNFGGDKARVNQTQASIGDITAQLAGTVNWQEGYDLTAKVLPFTLSSLAKILPTELPVDATGEVTAQLQVTGDIKEPVITGKINNTKTLKIAKSEFKDIQANFTADLNRVVLDNLQINPVAGGKITAEGTIVTNLKDSLASKRASDSAKMPVNLDFKADLPTEEIVAPYYQFPTQIEVGSLTAEGEVRGTISNPKALVEWQILQANTTSVDKNISAEGEIALINNNLLLQDTELQVGSGTIEVEGNSNLETKTWQTDIAANSIALTPWLSQLQLEGVNLDRPISIDNAKAQFQGKLDALDPNKIKGIADLNLNVDGGDVAVNSKLDEGTIQANAVTRDITVGKFIPNLPLPTEVKSARLDLSGRLKQLLEFSQTPNISSIDANLNANLATADGTVIARGKLNNNQWQTDIRAANLNTNYLVDTFAPNNDRVTNLENLNAQVDLTGSINPILNQEVNLPIKVNKASVQTGNQSLDAQGNLLISDLNTKPDVASADLDINSSIDFDRLPIKEIVATASNNNQLVADSVNVSGKAEFQGKLQGKNLISAPTQPGNVSLTGDVRLENFAFNDTVFDPVMTGNLVAKPGERIALNLQGKQDVIAAALEPCTANRCRFPYIPTRVELRQGEDTSQPVIAEGRKQGDIFSLDIVNFPLALLNLTPAKPVGIQGALNGKVTGEVDANLYTLATTGDITVDRPAIGYIKADRFKAEFEYNPNQNIARVATASFDLGKSQYNFQGDLNLQSGELEGKLNIPQAYIQDILTTFRWFTLEDLARLWQTPDYAEPMAVKPDSIITVNESITYKLNVLREIENRIQESAATKKAGSMPTLLDIEGRYQGEIIVGGTITNPQVSFDVEGDDWQWHTQPGFVNIVKNVKPLVGFFGLVKQESPRIALDNLLIQGNFQGETVNLDTATIQVEDAVLSLNGQLSANQQNANYQVQNLTINTIEKFITIPVDLTGTIDTTGKLTGTLSQPQIEGQITFTKGSFNGQELPLTMAGNYDYQENLFTFKTSEPSFIQAHASVPYPIQPGKSDRVYADIELTSEAFSLLGILTSNNLTWIDGEGTAKLKGVGHIDLARKNILYDLNATGEVNLDSATIKSAYFEAPLIATGKVTLNNQVLTVETLQGKFAEKNLSVQGNLPVLYAVNNIDNPLTINFSPGTIDVKELYKGEIAGKVVLTGAALSPIISGKVRLEKGRVFLPEKKSAESEPGTDGNIVENIQAASTNQQPSTEEPPAVIVRLQDFQVNLEDFRFQQSPLYEFEAAGDLTLNGAVDNIPNLQAEGTIQIKEGNVNLLSNNFSLVRRHENIIVFNPEAGILNPYLNIQMHTEVSLVNESGLSHRQLNQGSSEIPDPLAAVGNAKILTVNLDIQGEAQEILPSLGKDPSSYCSVHPDNANLTEEIGYTQAQLDQLAKCVKLAAWNSDGDRQIINTTAVSLSSIPSRSEGEIINLLGNRFLGFAEKLQNASSEELLNIGATQFILAPIQRRLFNKVDDAVVKAGKEVGLDYLRVFPFVEGVYEINEDSSIRAIYNYPIDLVNFINGDENFTNNDNEFKVEYQLRF